MTAILRPSQTTLTIDSDLVLATKSSLNSSLRRQLAGVSGLTFHHFLQALRLSSEPTQQLAYDRWASALGPHQIGHAMLNTIQVAAIQPDDDDAPVDYGERPHKLRFRSQLCGGGTHGRFEMMIPGCMNTDSSSLLRNTEWWVMEHEADVFGCDAFDGAALRERVRSSGLNAVWMPAEGRLRSGGCYGIDDGQTGSIRSETTTDVMLSGSLDGPGGKSRCILTPNKSCCVAVALLNTGTVRASLLNQLRDMVDREDPEIASVKPEGLHTVITKFVGRSQKLNKKFHGAIQSHHGILPCAR